MSTQVIESTLAFHKLVAITESQPVVDKRKENSTDSKILADIVECDAFKEGKEAYAAYEEERASWGAWMAEVKRDWFAKWEADRVANGMPPLPRIKAKNAPDSAMPPLPPMNDAQAKVVEDMGKVIEEEELELAAAAAESLLEADDAVDADDVDDVTNAELDKDQVDEGEGLDEDVVDKGDEDMPPENDLD